MTVYSSSFLHFFFEALAYIVGFRYFLALSATISNPLHGHPGRLWVAVGALLGAVVGAKAIYWLQYPTDVFSSFLDPAALIEGRTVVGGFLGGILGVEYVKKRVGLETLTGDIFVFPLLLGTMIGRVGCFFAGLDDHTYGNPTQLPWGVDFGDGVFRHPTQLYEIIVLGGLWSMLAHLRRQLRQPGDLFKLFMSSYLTFRVFIEFIKPPHGQVFTDSVASPPPAFLYGGLLTGIQVASLVGLLYYGPQQRRIVRDLTWRAD